MELHLALLNPLVWFFQYIGAESFHKVGLISIYLFLKKRTILWTFIVCHRNIWKKKHHDNLK